MLKKKPQICNIQRCDWCLVFFSLNLKIHQGRPFTERQILLIIVYHYWFNNIHWMYHPTDVTSIIFLLGCVAKIKIAATRCIIETNWSLYNRLFFLILYHVANTTRFSLLSVQTSQFASPPPKKKKLHQKMAQYSLYYNVF